MPQNSYRSHPCLRPILPRCVPALLWFASGAPRNTFLEAVETRSSKRVAPEPAGLECDTIRLRRRGEDASEIRLGTTSTAFLESQAYCHDPGALTKAYLDTSNMRPCPATSSLDRRNHTSQSACCTENAAIGSSDISDSAPYRYRWAATTTSMARAAGRTRFQGRAQACSVHVCGCRTELPNATPKPRIQIACSPQKSRQTFDISRLLACAILLLKSRVRHEHAELVPALYSVCAFQSVFFFSSWLT